MLTGASSPTPDIVEANQVSMDKGIMRMRPADRVPLKAGQTAADGSVSKVEVNATAGFTAPVR